MTCDNVGLMFQVSGQNATGQNATALSQSPGQKCHGTKCLRTKCHGTKCHKQSNLFFFSSQFLKNFVRNTKHQDSVLYKHAQESNRLTSSMQFIAVPFYMSQRFAISAYHTMFRTFDAHHMYTAA